MFCLRLTRHRPGNPRASCHAFQSLPEANSVNPDLATHDAVVFYRSTTVPPRRDGVPLHGPCCGRAVLVSNTPLPRRRKRRSRRQRHHGRPNTSPWSTICRAIRTCDATATADLTRVGGPAVPTARGRTGFSGRTRNHRTCHRNPAKSPLGHRSSVMWADDQ